MDASKMNHTIAVVLCLALSLFSVHAKLFEVFDNAQACLMMDATFVIHIDAMLHEEVVDTTKMTSADPNIRVGGACGDYPMLTLTFTDEVKWLLLFSKQNNIVTLKPSVNFIPDKAFPNPKITNDSRQFLYFDPAGMELSSPDQSYLCTSETAWVYTASQNYTGDLTYRVNSTVSNFRVQAYNVQNGDFSPAKECPQDEITTTMTSVTTVESSTTTPRPLPTYAKYALNGSDGKPCIVLEGDIFLFLRYQLTDLEGEVKQNQIEASVPRDAIPYGSCNITKDTQYIGLTFTPRTQKMSNKNAPKESFTSKWHLVFFFELTPGDAFPKGDPLEASESEYKLYNMTLQFRVSPALFPRCTPCNEKRVEVVRKGTWGLPHKSAGTDYYACISSVDMRLNTNWTMRTKGLRFKAFINDGNASFSGLSSQCLIDKDDESKKYFHGVFGTYVLGLGLAVVCFVYTALRKVNSRE